MKPQLMTEAEVIAFLRSVQQRNQETRAHATLDEASVAIQRLALDLTHSHPPPRNAAQSDADFLRALGIDPH